MPQLLLARHAQTIANVEQWISGWRDDVDLTKPGIDNSREMGRKLAEVHRAYPLAGILSSDLLRARHTTELVNETVGLEVVYDSGLRERDYGEWTGRNYEEWGKRPEDWANKPNDPLKQLWTQEDWAPPNGETLIEMRERALAAIQRGLNRWQGKPFLVISHRGTIRVLLQHLHGVSYAETPSPPDPPDWMEVEWN